MEVRPVGAVFRPHSPPCEAPLAELRRITKRFGGVTALQDVTLEVRAGEIHALVGENGAGKSTLMKILAGVYPPDGGEVRLRGRTVTFADPFEARQHGISIVFQELSLFPHLSVAANVFANAEPHRAGLLEERRMARATRELLSSLGCDLDPGVRVGRLRAGERQLVEIARALRQASTVIVLDEPTSALTGPEVERLFLILRQLRERGLGIVYVSHRLEEVFALSDRITVLRDGRHQGTWLTGEVDAAQIVQAMTGRALQEFQRTRGGQERSGAPLLEVRGLVTARLAAPLDLQVWPGEIVGLVGVEGSGVEEVFLSLFGLERPLAGEIRFEGRPVRLRGPDDAIRLGWALVPPNRREQGLIMGWPVRSNISLALLERLARGVGWLDGLQERRIADQIVRSLGIVAEGVDQPVWQLSGGNQQKVVVGRWLATRPRLLLLYDPTRGIDVGAKREIHRLCDALAREGLGILLTSSELEEVVGLSDRVLAFHRGRAVRAFGPGEATREALLRCILGAGEPAMQGAEERGGPTHG
jgi:rhamnose transport system ATP-binding protein